MMANCHKTPAQPFFFAFRINLTPDITIVYDCILPVFLVHCNQFNLMPTTVQEEKFCVQTQLMGCNACNQKQTICQTVFKAFKEDNVPDCV